MPGLGTIINVAAIVVGGILGLLCGNKLPERVQHTLMMGNGVAVMFLGIAGAMEKMRSPDSGTMMIVLSIAIGGLLGGALDLDGRMERFGVWLREKTGSRGSRSRMLSRQETIRRL